jgi:hypothetical protein
MRYSTSRYRATSSCLIFVFEDGSSHKTRDRKLSCGDMRTKNLPAFTVVYLPHSSAAEKEKLKGIVQRILRGVNTKLK